MNLKIAFIFAFLFARISNADKVDRFLNIIRTARSDFKIFTEMAGDCSLLLDRDYMVLRHLLDNGRRSLVKSLLLGKCTRDFAFSKRFFMYFERDGSVDGINLLMELMSEFSDHENYFKAYLLEICTTNRHDGCIKHLKAELCALRDRKGRNALHLAAIYNYERLSHFAQRCKFLIDSRDFSNKLPMEYVESFEMAEKLNEIWLEVAKKHYLSVDSAEKRAIMMGKFANDSEEGSGSIPQAMECLTIFKQTFIARQEIDFEDFYCDPIGMRLNFHEGQGVDRTGVVIEWIVNIMREMFPESAEALDGDAEEFKAPIFVKSDSPGYSLNTAYPPEVFKMAGFLLKVSCSYGICRNEFISEDQSPDHFVAFQEGMSLVRSLRIEIHNTDPFRMLVIRGKNYFMNIAVKDFEGVLGTKEELNIMNAFNELSDNELITLVRIMTDGRFVKGSSLIPIYLTIHENDLIKASFDGKKTCQISPSTEGLAVRMRNLINSFASET